MGSVVGPGAGPPNIPRTVNNPPVADDELQQHKQKPINNTITVDDFIMYLTNIFYFRIESPTRNYFQECIRNKYFFVIKPE